MDQIKLEPSGGHEAAATPTAETETASNAASPQDTPAAATGSPPTSNDAVGSESCVLKLKGLPYSAGETQIREFFSGFTVKEVAFVYEPDGRPSGLAFAEFASREEALQAMSKNGAYIGDRYVRLLHVPKQEMQEQVRLGTIAIPGNAHRRGRGQQQQQQQQQHVRGGSGYDGRSGGGHQQHNGGYGGRDHIQLPHGALLQPPQRFMEVQGYAPASHHAAFQQQGTHVPLVPAGPGAAVGHGGVVVATGPGPMGQLLQLPPHHGGAVAVQMGPNGVAQVVQHDGGQIGVAGAQMGVPHMQMAPPHMALAFQLGGMALAGPPGQHMQPHPAGFGPPVSAGGGPQGGFGSGAQPVMVIGTDSKTIKIRGLPFRATPLDIFNFFEGFEHIAESLQLGVDALGRPSGEAWLTFGSCDEALRAVRERNRHYLGNRYLELSLT